MSVSKRRSRATIAAGWTKCARPIMAKLETALQAGRLDEARELARAISMDGLAEAQRSSSMSRARCVMRPCA
jgi:hypothetical protein